MVNKINVLIADGRKLLREGLVLLLSKHHDLRVVGEADDAAAAARLIDALDVDVVILNIPPPTQVAVGIISSLANSRPGLRVVALTFNPSAERVRALIDAGARGCLTKECASEELVAAIRSVMAGTVYLSPRMMNIIVNGYVRPAAVQPSRQRPLAPREREILQRIASGQSTKEIAFDLDVGTKTIETHRRRIMEKLNRFSVAELTQYAVMEGLITLEVPV